MLFTVVICSQSFIDKCKGTYSGFLNPLLNNDENYVFCPWDSSKDTFDEALPDLKGIIDKKKDWRAVVVLDDELYGRQNIAKRNPFNYVDAVNFLDELETAEQVIRFREQRTAFCRDSINNPLMKLGIWLDGSPFSGSPELPEMYSQLPDVSDENYFDKLRELRLTALEVELDRLVEARKTLVEENFSTEGELQRKPKQIIAVSERLYINDNEEAATAWNIRNEFEYSRFYEDNLYPDKFRYILFNIPYVKGSRVENDYLNFLVFVLVLAQNAYPPDAVKANRVYTVDMSMDKEKINNFYAGYISKLFATLRIIKNQAGKMTRKKEEPLDGMKAQELFESDVKIPVVINKDYKTDELFAEYKGLGLATDCPVSEKTMWDDQSHSILKKFIRYLKEPRRAIKTAAETDFHMNWEIDDEQIARLNEYQKEDISFRILEEEEKMVETATPHLFKTEEYNERIEKENKAINRNIAQRMTRTKTVIVGIIAVVAFLFGFLPLIFDNANTSESLGFALVITLSGLAVFLISGLIYLLVMCFRLRTRFKWFNRVMRDILGEIESGLSAFSKYLSHACNVMRCFSVLNYSKKVLITKQNILKKHAWDIERKIDDVSRLFSGYLDLQSRDLYDAEPFDYDFTVLSDYDYEIPYDQILNRISFIQNGNVIEVPINYVDSIMLTREELYD